MGDIVMEIPEEFRLLSANQKLHVHHESYCVSVLPSRLRHITEQHFLKTAGSVTSLRPDSD